MYRIKKLNFQFSLFPTEDQLRFSRRTPPRKMPDCDKRDGREGNTGASLPPVTSYAYRRDGPPTHMQGAYTSQPRPRPRRSELGGELRPPPATPPSSRCGAKINQG